jgi:hypothetical protein
LGIYERVTEHLQLIRMVLVFIHGSFVVTNVNMLITFGMALAFAVYAG